MKENMNWLNLDFKSKGTRYLDKIGQIRDQKDDY